MSENELDALKRRLAYARKVCDAIGGCSYLEDAGVCLKCLSTGQVFVLEGVRHECTSCRGGGTVSIYPLGHPDKVRVYTCGACQGAGYIPTDDPLLWFKAAWKAAFENAVARPRMYEYHSDYIFSCAKGDFLGALRALEAALSAQGLLGRK